LYHSFIKLFNTYGHVLEPNARQSIQNHNGYRANGLAPKCGLVVGLPNNRALLHNGHPSRHIPFQSIHALVKVLAAC
jgi:hypothetical protein